MISNPQKAVEKLQRQYKNQNEYIKNNYKRLSVTIKRETFEKLEEIYGKGFSINGYINELINADLENLEGPEQQEQQEQEPKQPTNKADDLPDFMKD